MSYNQRKVQIPLWFSSLLLVALFVVPAYGEQRQNAQSSAGYISGANTIPFTSGGAAILPDVVLSSLMEGSLSDEMVFLLLNQMMTSCVENALKEIPDQRHSYVVAKEIFNMGLCQLFSCMQQGIMIGMLTGTEGGGQYAASTMAKAMSQRGGCDGSKSPAIDPKLVKLLSNSSAGN